MDNPLSGYNLLLHWGDRDIRSIDRGSNRGNNTEPPSFCLKIKKDCVNLKKTAIQFILYKLVSLSNKGTDRIPKRHCMAVNYTRVLLGIFNFSFLNSTGRSEGTAGGNREHAVQPNREGPGVFARKGLFHLLDCHLVQMLSQTSIGSRN